MAKNLYLLLFATILWLPKIVFANTILHVASNSDSELASPQNLYVQISAEREELLLFFEEEDLIITATKRPQTLEQAPAIATVITAEQIRNIGARDIKDILRLVPGIGVYMGASYGAYSIESRGIKSINSEKILFMIDGHSVNGLLPGGATWVVDDLAVENIKRVEVIRGPGSALYGANAFVAVINVITKGAKDVNGLEVSAGGGSFGTQHYNMLFGKDYSGLEIAGAFDYLESDGPDSYVKEDGLGRSGYTQEWKNKSDAALKVSYGGFYFSGRYINREDGDYVGILNNLNDKSRIKTEQYLGEIGFNHTFGETLDVYVKAYYDQFRRMPSFLMVPAGVIPAFPNGMQGGPDWKEKTTGAEAHTNYKLANNNTLTIGVMSETRETFDLMAFANFNPLTGAPLDSLQNVSDGANFNEEKSRHIFAMYLQDIWKFTSSLEATFGVRYDEYSDFGNTVNPRLGVVWNYSEKGNLKLLYGTAFRAPGFEELYNKNNPFSAGNPNLNPEEVETYEASLGYSFSEHARVMVTYFKSIYTEKIQLAADPAIPGLLRFENTGGAEVDGVEAEFKFNFNAWASIYGNYTYQNPRDKDTGGRLPDTPDHKGNVGTNVALLNHLNVNMNVFMTDDMPRAKGDEREPVPGYALVDLTVILKNFYKTFEVRASAYNLFDKDYADPSAAGTLPGDYPRAGLSYMLEVRYKI